MKRKIIRIPSRHLLDIFLTQNGTRTVVELVGVPQSAKSIGFWLHHESDSLDLVIEDESFPDVPPGIQFPHLEVVFHWIQIKEPE